MRRRTLRLAARGSFAITLALCLGTTLFLSLAWNVPKLRSEFGFKGYAILFALVVGGLGLLRAAQQQHAALRHRTRSGGSSAPSA